MTVYIFSHDLLPIMKTQKAVDMGIWISDQYKNQKHFSTNLHQLAMQMRARNTKLYLSFIFCDTGKKKWC